MRSIRGILSNFATLLSSSSSIIKFHIHPLDNGKIYTKIKLLDRTAIFCNARENLHYVQYLSNFNAVRWLHACAPLRLCVKKRAFTFDNTAQLMTQLTSRTYTFKKPHWSLKYMCISADSGNWTHASLMSKKIYII